MINRLHYPLLDLVRHPESGNGLVVLEFDYFKTLEPASGYLDVLNCYYFVRVGLAAVGYIYWDALQEPCCGAGLYDGEFLPYLQGIGVGVGGELVGVLAQ